MCVAEGARVNDLEGLEGFEEVLSALQEVVRRRSQRAKVPGMELIPPTSGDE
jgi:hypothetical protein